jgi:hypothetical protein
MSTPDLPKDVDKAQHVESMMPVGGSDQPRESTTAFKALMQEPEGTKPAQLSSPFALARAGSTPLAVGPTLSTIQTQIVHAQSTLGDISSLLNTPKLKMKPSTKFLLASKLDHATQKLRAVNAKIGGEEPQEMESDHQGSLGPVQKFLNYVSAGQASLSAARRKVQELSEHAETLNPAELLAVQVKMNEAQRFIDYSSVLLSRAVEGMKQLFNIQL